MMVTRAERQFFAGSNLHSVVGPMQQALQAQGVLAQQVGSQAWNGSGTPSSWGVVMKVSIVAMPSPSGFSVEFQSWAELESNGLILFCMLGLFFFPAAAIIGFLAYQELVQRQSVVHHAVWAPLSHLFVAPNFPPAFAGPR